MWLRPYSSSDAEAVAQLFTESVHGLAAPFYDEAQREAWAPSCPDTTRWQARLAALEVWLAEDDQGLCGMLGATPQGYLDLLFTAPRVARRGVASMLYARVESDWRRAGVIRVSTDASLAAKSFFLRHDFHVVEEQLIERGGQQLRRFAMAKSLCDPTP